MQSINQPQSALIAGMQQGLNYQQPAGGVMQQGFRGGGLASIRPGYMGGGTIGGGIIHGTPMGSRTGYWNPKKWVKKKLKQAKNIATKLTPKELAPAMTWAAPFMGPIAGPMMAGLGSLKMHGKLDPRIMASALLPHARFGMPTKLGGSGMGYGKWGGGSSLRNILTGKGVGTQEGILNKFGNFGNKLDAKIFGSPDMVSKSMHPTEGVVTTRLPGEKGLFNLGGNPVGEGDLTEVLMEKMTTDKGGKKSMWTAVEKLSTVLTASSSYAHALELANQAGIPEEMMPGSEEDYMMWKNKIDEQTKDWKKGTIYEGNAMGGIPRTRYAMGSAQFPPQRRTGLKWGSDNGEGLGGEEVEADMRYEGGFMPYGEEPKADDVPARLSKDEFVFTDEAVAGAGDGDVELGASRLYNVMKNLESGGRLSEESEGAMGEGIGTII